MDKLDWKIRRFLVDEGYLFPQTDAEIERVLKELDEETKIMKNPEEIFISLNSTEWSTERASEDSVSYTLTEDVTTIVTQNSATNKKLRATILALKKQIGQMLGAFHATTPAQKTVRKNAEESLKI